MKYEKADVKFIKFDNKDVIATSAILDTGTCGQTQVDVEAGNDPNIPPCDQITQAVNKGF